jgi:hypothetical protein
MPSREGGVHTIIGDQPEEFAEFIKADIEKWRKIVRQKGLTAGCSKRQCKCPAFRALSSFLSFSRAIAPSP